MKRILFDTNVVLDVLLDRQPYVEASAAVWAAVEAGASEGMLAAHAVTTIHYLLGKELSSAKARRIVSSMAPSCKRRCNYLSPILRMQ
jgi:predicted nucleic acid-binding protein